MASHPIKYHRERARDPSILKSMAAYILLLALLMLTSPIALASDPSPLQDFCVADEKSTVFVNGHVCKDPKLATPDDFFTSGFDIPGNTANRLGSNVTRVEVDRIPGLNTLGISFARVDFAPFGLNPPHTHPRATEMLTVVEGTLLAGFVTSNPNKFFMKELKKGDVFVIPQGLIHFEVNRGPTKAFTIQGFNSQNPGVITSANALFGSKPPIPDDVLARAFQLDKKLVDWLLWRFSTVNN